MSSQVVMLVDLPPGPGVGISSWESDTVVSENEINALLSESESQTIVSEADSSVASGGLELGLWINLEPYTWQQLETLYWR